MGIKGYRRLGYSLNYIDPRQFDLTKPQKRLIYELENCNRLYVHKEHTLNKDLYIDGKKGEILNTFFIGSRWNYVTKTDLRVVKSLEKLGLLKILEVQKYGVVKLKYKRRKHLKLREESMMATNIEYRFKDKPTEYATFFSFYGKHEDDLKTEVGNKVCDEMMVYQQEISCFAMRSRLYSKMPTILAINNRDKKERARIAKKKRRGVMSKSEERD